jgi:chlorophyll synthase
MLKLNKINVYGELLRPFTLIVPAVGFLCGAIMAFGRIPPLIIWVLGISCTVSLNAASNLNNQYFDRKIDEINKPYRPLPLGKVSPKQVMRLAICFYLMALILAYTVNIQFFIISVSAALISFFYSAPPFRLKRYTFFSNLVIALPRGLLLIVAGWSSVRSVFVFEPWFVGGIFFLYLLGAAATKDFADIKGDAKFGINTLPVVYGPQETAKMISPFLVIPFLLIPLGVILKIIRLTSLPLTMLAIWGLYIRKLLLKNPQALTIEANHVSWKHMYLLLVTGQIGFAIAYLL